MLCPKYEPDDSPDDIPDDRPDDEPDVEASPSQEIESEDDMVLASYSDTRRERPAPLQEEGLPLEGEQRPLEGSKRPLGEGIDGEVPSFCPVPRRDPGMHSITALMINVMTLVLPVLSRAQAVS